MRRGTAIRTRLIKIGNSQGIRIPKTLIEQVGLGQDVELEAQGGQLVIRPVKHPRTGWEAEFRTMAARGDDRGGAPSHVYRAISPGKAAPQVGQPKLNRAARATRHHDQRH